jgi:hypothetical protein
VSRIVQQAALFRRERASETIRLDHPFPLFRGHGTQIADRSLHSLPPVRRQIPHLRINPSRLLLLAGGQMLPSFHAIQDSLLLFWRQAIEVLQALLQLLLALRRKPPELRIVFQRSLLFLRR